jgi:hypothetical protein
MIIKNIKSLVLSTVFLALLVPWQSIASSQAAGPGEVLLELNTSLSAPELTASLQAALDGCAKQNGKLRITNREGVFLISKTLYLSSGVHVDFNNCTLKRDAKYGVFDMMLNKGRLEGNSKIVISNLKLDGNKDADKRTATKKEDRFTGLGLYKVNKARLENIVVTRTVNAEIQNEGAKSGILFENCSEVEAKQLQGHYNDRSAILIYNSAVSIKGAVTSHNSGSGITSCNADYSEYTDIVTHDNGYSQLSVNGQNSKIARVNAYNGASGFANLNIGHNSQANDSSNTVATDINISGGRGWGISVNGSNDVKLSDVNVSGNSNFNIYVIENVNRLKLDNVRCFGSKSTGIYYKSGSGHTIDRTDVYQNGIYGIEITKKAEVVIGPEVRIYDNRGVISKTVADLVVTGTAHVKGRLMGNSKARSQKANVWIAGGKLYVDSGQLIPSGAALNIVKTSGGALEEKFQ